MKMIKELLAVILLMALLACENKEDDASQVVILFDDILRYQSVNAGEKLKFRIRALTSKERIEQFSVVSFDSEKGSVDVLDTMPGVKDFSMDFLYTVPVFSLDSVRHRLTFKALDNRDAWQETSMILIVKGRNLVLEEKAGLILYAGNSGREDGFSLDSPSQTFICSLTDSARIDVYAYADPADKTEYLSCEWRTNTDVEFVKVNTFDYVNATSVSIENTFLSSVRSNYVRNLQRGDIVLAGKKGVAWGAFHVVAIYEEEGVWNDGYLINYKSIQ